MTRVIQLWQHITGEMHDITPSWVGKHLRGHFQEAKMYFFQAILSVKYAEDVAVLASLNLKFKWNIIGIGYGAMDQSCKELIQIHVNKKTEDNKLQAWQDWIAGCSQSKKKGGKKNLCPVLKDKMRYFAWNYSWQCLQHGTESVGLR